MKKIVKISIIILLIGVVSAGGYFAYKYYKKIKSPMTDVIDSIPNNAAFILKIKNPERITEKIQDSNDSIISTLMSFSEIYKSILIADSILNKLKEDENIISIINNHPLFVSVHMTSYNRFDVLFSIKLNQTSSKKDFETYLENIGQINTSIIEDVEIKELKIDTNKFYFIWDRGILSTTSSKQLIDKQAYTISSKTQDNNKLLKKMISSEGKDSDINVYLNFDYIHRFIGKNANQKYRNIITEIGKISNQSVLDLNIKNNLITLNGFSAAPDSVRTFLNALKDVKAGSLNFDKFIPSRTSQIVAFGAKDFSEYFDKLSTQNWNLKKQKEIDELDSKYNIDIESHFNNWLVDELVYIIYDSDFIHLKENSFALLKTIDAKEAEFTLDKLAEKVNKIDNNSSDTVFYRDYQIKQIKIPYLLSSLYGGFFDNLSNTYYVSLGDYILFGNSTEALQSYLNNIMVENTLEKNQDFQLFKENLSSESHLLLYSNLNYYTQLFSKLLNPEFEKLISESEFPIHNFSAISVQFLSGKAGSYTSIILQQSSQKADSQPISWQTALDLDAVWGPYPTLNHRTGAREILVVDRNNLLYRINAQGQIVWKIPLTSKPLSDLFLIDFYNNGKYQYLFNSKETLYLFDLNGNTVEDYPISLPKKASAGLSLLDYNNDKNYRIIIPLMDNSVYNFTKYGSETDGWEKPKMDNYISRPAQYFRLGSKDVIVISDTIGDVIYASRKGINRIEANLAFTNNFRTDFYFDENSRNPRIVTTDIAGRLIKIDFDGNVEKKLLSNLSMYHSFYYEDFDRDGIKDYIFVDRNTLKIFSEEYQEILSLDFEHPLSRRLEVINKNQNDSIYLILQNQKDNSLIFVGKDKQLNMDKKYKSNNNFIVSYATKYENLRLITTNGRVISNYIFE